MHGERRNKIKKGGEMKLLMWCIFLIIFNSGCEYSQFQPEKDKECIVEEVTYNPGVGGGLFGGCSIRPYFNVICSDGRVARSRSYKPRIGSSVYLFYDGWDGCFRVVNSGD